MQVVWCPHKELLQEYKGREEEVLAGLTGEGDKEAPVREVAKEVGAEKGLEGWPGEVGDGWAVLLNSLEDFPYERFGIVVKGKA